MKAVVIGERSDVSMEQIMAVYPRHKAVVDKFVAQGRSHRHQSVRGPATGPRRKVLGQFQVRTPGAVEQLHTLLLVLAYTASGLGP
jgi:hypothetical protein